MYQRILVPVDGSPASNQALANAIGLARPFGARLRLVHVVDETAYLTGYDQFGGYSGQLISAMRDQGDRVLQEGMKTVRDAGLEVDSMLFDKFGEHLGETVAKSATLWNADLIVVGTHGRRGLRRMFLGSGAEQVIRLAPVPVLVVRIPEGSGENGEGTEAPAAPRA